MAVGETLRRLVGKALLSTGVAKAQVESMSPLQVGVGVRGAADNVAIGFQSMVNHLGLQPGWVALKIDLRNAFNCISRAQVLRAATHYTPALYHYLKTCYSNTVPLFCGGRVLASQEGTHQGCPLGPLGFAVGIHPILEAVCKETLLHWQVWYLDDGLLIGDPSNVGRALEMLSTRLEAIGLSVNFSKCELWGPAQDSWTGSPEIHKVPWTPGSGLVILGTPVNYPNTTTFADGFWKDVTGRLREAVQKVTDMVDLQCAHHLLRKCLDACKVNHLLRTTDCYHSDSAVYDCDSAVVEGFEDLLGTGLSGPQRVQLGLPLRAGGCGVRCPLSVRPAARIAALATFYTAGSKDVGLPDYAAAPCAAWLTPVLSELQGKLGPNFDPLTVWAGKHSLFIGGTAGA